MFYPAQVFVSSIGIDVQTMLWHGGMIVQGVYLWYSSAVKPCKRTLYLAMPVFGAAMLIAILLNEVVVLTGLAGEHLFDMFYISRHFHSTLPVFSLIEPHLPYVLELLVYFLVFSAIAALICLAAWGISRLGGRKKDRKSSS